MRASQLEQVLSAVIIPTKRPAMIWGPPGVGKSQIVAQCGAKAGIEVIDWRLVLMDSVDLRGIPCVKQDLTHWNPPAELPSKGKGILFLDELPQAATATSNAATQLILDRKLGNYRLPDGWLVIAAGNREEDRAATNRMPSHVANRFIHLSFDVHTGDWLEWAQGAGNLDPRVFAFIKYRPEFLHRFDAKSKEKSFASPRAWAFMSEVLQEADRAAMGWVAEERVELAAGVVGKEAAVEFVGFLRIMEKLIDLDSILLDPAKAKLPDDPAVVYALVYALLDRSDRKGFAKVATYINRLSKEFQFLFYREVKVRKGELQKSKEFIDWAAKNHDFA